jgi:hypothetical protein
MEKTKPLHRTFASMALIAFAAGFSDYVFLDRPEDTASTTQSNRYTLRIKNNLDGRYSKSPVIKENSR